MPHHPTVRECLLVAMTVPPPEPHPITALTLSATERANIAGLMYGSFMLLLICRHVSLTRRRSRK